MIYLTKLLLRSQTTSDSIRATIISFVQRRAVEDILDAKQALCQGYMCKHDTPQLPDQVSSSSWEVVTDCSVISYCRMYPTTCPWKASVLGSPTAGRGRQSTIFSSTHPKDPSTTALGTLYRLLLCTGLGKR